LSKFSTENFPGARAVVDFSGGCAVIESSLEP
jgi:hypothetical protein